MQNLTKGRRQPLVAILQQETFYNIFTYSVIVAKNRRKIRPKCLVHEFSFKDIFNDIYHSFKTAALK